MNKPKLPANPARDTKSQREARLEYIFHLIGEGSTVESATKAAGCSYRSFLNWCNADLSIMSRYEQVQQELHDRVGEVAKICALKALTDHRYQTSMIFYLRSKAGWQDGTGFVAAGQEMPSIQFKQARKVVRASETESKGGEPPVS